MSIKYWNSNIGNKILFPQMIEYANYFDSNKVTSFRVRDEKLLKTYSKIWKRKEQFNEKRI